MPAPALLADEALLLEAGEHAVEVVLLDAHLLGDLRDGDAGVRRDQLQRLLADPDVTLLIARDGDEIVGTTTVIVYTTPYWIKARLDEVVVDESARGQGVGEDLVKAALDVARERGAQIAELQSGRTAAREPAHRLYERLGFQLRNSDVFRIGLR